MHNNLCSWVFSIDDQHLLSLLVTRTNVLSLKVGRIITGRVFFTSNWQAYSASADKSPILFLNLAWLGILTVGQQAIFLFVYKIFIVLWYFQGIILVMWSFMDSPLAILLPKNTLWELLLYSSHIHEGQIVRRTHVFFKGGTSLVLVLMMIVETRDIV